MVGMMALTYEILKGDVIMIQQLGNIILNYLGMEQVAGVEKLTCSPYTAL